jgi:catechol-2,3-dioxygenase
MIELKFQGIDHIHINVNNRIKAEKWYQTVLGFSRVKKLEFWAEGGGPLTLKNEADSIHLALFENCEIQNTTVAFKISASALARCIKHLQTKNIHVTPLNNQVSWCIYFKDLDGNLYEITTNEYEQFSNR